MLAGIGPPSFVSATAPSTPAPAIFIAPLLPQTPNVVSFEVIEFDEPRAIFESVTQIDLMLLNFDDVDTDGDKRLSAPEFSAFEDLIDKNKNVVKAEWIESEGLLQKAIEDAKEDGEKLELSKVPTEEQIEALKRYVREDGNIDVFIEGPYGILQQNRFSGDQWKLRELFSNPAPEKLPPGDSLSDESGNIDSDDTFDDMPLDQPDTDNAEPGASAAGDDNDSLGSATAESKLQQGAMISSALWLLQRSREPRESLPEVVEHGTSRFGRAARRSRRRERTTAMG